MRLSISAQSCASVPPAPALISTKASLPSASPDSRLSISRRLASADIALRRDAEGVGDHAGVAIRLGQPDQLHRIRDRSAFEPAD